MTRRPSPIWTAFGAWLAFLACYVVLTQAERRPATHPRQVVRRVVIVEDAPAPRRRAAPAPTAALAPAPVVTRSS